MLRRFIISFGVFVFTVCASRELCADDLQLNLEFDYGVCVDGSRNKPAWSLYAQIIDTGAGADGSFGLSAVRLLLDGIDFGTDGDAVSIGSGIGAIDPVSTTNGPRIPVLRQPMLMLAGGTIDILYGQDLSDVDSVVTGVGTGIPALIASGTYLGSSPAFGSDGVLSSAGLFLDAGSGPFGEAIVPDNVFLSFVVFDPWPVGDVNLDGVVDSLDIEPFIERILSGTFQSEADADRNCVVDALDIEPFVQIILVGQVITSHTVPEPTSLLLACFGLFGLKCWHGKKD